MYGASTAKGHQRQAARVISKTFQKFGQFDQRIIQQSAIDFFFTKGYYIKLTGRKIVDTATIITITS